MRINRSSTIAGYPAKQVRDFVRRLGHDEWARDAVAEYFHIEGTVLDHLIKDLVALKILAPAEPRPGGRRMYFSRGSEAGRLANASFLKPISRAKAEKLVAELLQRIKEVNADPDYLYLVAVARLFGSYIDPTRSELGDLDIAIALAPRPQCSPEEFTTLLRERADASGKQFRNLLSRYAYAENEVMTFLKCRNPYLSFHTVVDLEGIGAESCVLYTKG